MNIEHRINSFSRLGYLLSQRFSNISDIPKDICLNNSWFTDENVFSVLKYWSKVLNKKIISEWINKYNIENLKFEKKVLIIMPGNIPIVGMHDLLCVLLLGHRAIVKMSSKDKILLPILISMLENIDSSFQNKIQFVENIKIDDFDAVIATGNENSSKYFDFYFRNQKRLIRNNRTSICIISGNENKKEMNDFSNDVFKFFGLGCRNVSHVLVPNGYDFSMMIDCFSRWNNISNNKYLNNYNYYKTLYIMDNKEFIDGGHFILLKSNELFSPVSVLNYSYYENNHDIKKFFTKNKNNLQCIVSKSEVNFGDAQNPCLSDYSDNIDTIDFLIKI